MKEVSVLMSIYNETERMIQESVDSILNQTFKNFEFIIVCDNPLRRKEIDDIIRRFNDDRIKLFFNEKNIGLALSMNKAAEIASAKIFARMDADDIAEPNRFEKEIEVINNGYDFVFSKYSYIDINSEAVEGEYEQNFYPSKELPFLIALSPSIVHHPTVMFTKEIFLKAGGYRNFPCSQDVDLWFRMAESKCKFCMLPDRLLRYRINPMSTSSQKWFQQQLTIHYIMNLSVERIKNGKDSYSLDNYLKYLEDNNVSCIKKQNKLEKSERYLSLAMNFKQNGRKTLSLVLRLYVFIVSKPLRDFYLKELEKKRLLRKIMVNN